MEEQEKKDDRIIDIETSMLMVALENHALMRQILEVMMGIRMEGKTEQEKKEYSEKINKRLLELRNDARSLLFTRPKKP